MAARGHARVGWRLDERDRVAAMEATSPRSALVQTRLSILMQTVGTTLLAVRRCSVARVWMSAQDSRSVHRLLYLAAVWTGTCQPKRRPSSARQHPTRGVPRFAMPVRLPAFAQDQPCFRPTDRARSGHGSGLMTLLQERVLASGGVPYCMCVPLGSVSRAAKDGNVTSTAEVRVRSVGQAP